MIEFKKQTSKNPDDDIVGCDDYGKSLNQYLSEDFEPVRQIFEDNKDNINNITLFSMFYKTPLDTLKKLSISKKLFNDSKYQCPYNGYRHYSLLPIMLISSDFKNNYSGACEDFSNPINQLDAILDTGFQMWLLKSRFKKYPEDDQIGTQTFIKNLTDSLLKTHQESTANFLQGSGYTIGCNAHDGHNSKNIYLMELDNGDFLFVSLLNWYNK